MKMIKRTTWDDVAERLKKRGEIYNALPPEEKLVVDQFMEKVAGCGGNIEKIVALGPHPLNEKYKAAGL